MFPKNDFITTLLNIRESDIENFFVSSNDNETIYNICLKRRKYRCPYCYGDSISHGRISKIINHPTLRNTNSYINYNINRYICKSCKRTFLDRNPFSFPNFNSSYLLLNDVLKKLKNLNYTLDMISKELNISPTQISKYLDSYIVIPERPLPECIGIDELHSPILSKRNSSYICVIVDNKNRGLYEILDSRSKEYLSSFFVQKTRQERLNVKYVTIDMWEPYRDVVMSYLPNAIVAVDPFHVIEHLCKDFDKLRISLMKQCMYESNGYYLLKKWNWLLTKDNVDLDNKKEYNHRFKMPMNRRDILNLIKYQFPILYEAYQLKELYREFNKTASYEEAIARYDTIVQYFKNSNVAQYTEFVSLLITWKTEILNSFKRPYSDQKLSNAYAEHINGKLRTYITVSRGIANFKRFRARALYALNDNIFYAISTNLTTNKRIGRKRGQYKK